MKAVYESRELSFDERHQLQPSDPRAAYVDDGLMQLEALQQALVSHRLAGLTR